MKRSLLSWSGTFRLFGRSEMEFLQSSFESDNARVCRVALKGGRP